MKKLHEAELESRLAALSAPGLEAEVGAIADFLRRGRDVELASIDPGAFARRAGLPRRAAIRAFLHLAKAGVLELGWKLRCPHCRGASSSSPSLAALGHDSHCPVCRMDYKAGFDREVEITFSPSPEVIELEGLDPFEANLATFCLEPGLSIALEAGEKRFLDYELLPGNYVLGCAASMIALGVEVTEEAGGPGGRVGFRYKGGSPGASSARIKPGKTRIFVENATPEPAELSFARVADGEWVGAALVSTIQEFRDFFASEVVSPDESFAIGDISVVFTDIKGSTEMYERLGDEAAFAIVKEHFAILERAIAEHDGAVVKTIGDAVMAVFSRPEDALRACRAMIDAFDDFNAAEGSRDQLIIKVGAHGGPCIAVNLNSLIDYFGTSINQAARVQSLSDGRDVMVSGTLFEAGGAAELLGPSGWSWESFSASLKGISEAMTVYKLVKGRLGAGPGAAAGAGAIAG